VASLLAIEQVPIYQMRHFGLYVHIPFCEARCHYCDFVTFINSEDKTDSYIRALSHEFSLHQGKKIDTIFFGGGTPSILTPIQFQKISHLIRSQFDLSNLQEFTIEVNPESASIEKFQIYKDCGVNRLSFGLQTMDESLLKSIGRLHDKKRFLQAYNMAETIGFKNINTDLMFGLPGQSLESWENTLEEIVKISPAHISTYALKIEKGARWGAQKLEVDDDLEADMYLLASDYLKSQGYNHYEISNFSKPGLESKHNLKYWENQETIGVGVSSTSFINEKRIKNTSNLESYIRSGISAGSIEKTIESLEKNEAILESTMLALRLERGVSFERVSGMNIPMIKTFLDKHLAQLNKGSYQLTPKGWLLSNQLFQYFVS
jgi:oxygen-independent coproporphyrinogen-3 oxidase